MSQDDNNPTSGHTQPTPQTSGRAQPAGSHEPPSLGGSAKAKSPGSAGAAHLTFDQAKLVAKKTWSQLNDADFAQAEGSLDKLYGVIQAKVGTTRDAIKMKLEKPV